MNAPQATQINLQFIAAIGDAGIEAGLVDGPEGVEIIRLIVAQCKSHPSILDGPADSARNAMKAMYLPECENCEKNIP